MQYLYRFDTLQRLRDQSGDPVFRAKRVTQGHGAFDHHQVLKELETLQDGQGVYRFCFWRDWKSVLKHMHATCDAESPWIIQRIPVNHPAFAHFQQDDDEYLVGDAWIYWQVCDPDLKTPNWSPTGIPHDDIEVLTPQGLWERLSISNWVRDSSFDAWRCLSLRGVNGHTPVFTRSLTRRTDSGDNQTWVLLRQKNGPWKVIWNNPESIAEAVWLLLSDFRAVGLKNVRWVVSLECDDRVLSAEVFPSFTPPTTTGLQRLLGIYQERLEDCGVTIDKPFAHLDQDAQRQLYRDFGIGAVLLLNRNYSYSRGLLESFV
ncbi:hypothetical protein LXA47_28810 [Massilia sp. P8910]|uniref:hypothetical protein n=1 Tax=Massilia antarctica TaxID=2765360 RepID=UPI001E29363C|nr:hypothetical protein [Massilia antarctica]MCE3607575.1 hypothetical protein [Massilia antarctica]